MAWESSDLRAIMKTASTIAVVVVSADARLRGKETSNHPGKLSQTPDG
jgi:hypothetical protein